MKFVKMQGCGNDFVVIDAIKNKISNPSKLAQKVCQRQFGVGADGLVLCRPSKIADIRMQFLNPDGSEAEMCGNGIRCFAKFVKTEGIIKKESLDVETKAGIIKTKFKGSMVCVDMGEPRLSGKEIPVNIDKEKIVKEKILVDGVSFTFTAVSMGNPHCVIFVPKITSELVHKVGPKIESHKLFPKRTNVEFAKIVNRGNIDMRVYERGAGETLACGTGACATAVAAALIGLANRKSVVHLLGGNLLIDWDIKTNHIFMTGPAEYVFTGEL